jgi:hypothetical protein
MAPWLPVCRQYGYRESQIPCRTIRNIVRSIREVEPILRKLKESEVDRQEQMG